MKNLNENTREKKINIALVCLAVIFLTSLPLMTDFLLSGTLLQYQLLRIETLKDALIQYGPVLWAKPEWVNPQGLSFAFFYGETFLYIPALFRILGCNIQMSFMLFLLLINIATVLTSYYVFSNMFRNAYTGLLGTALYSASIYRIFLLYAEVELGEALALTFVPLVLYGLYLLLIKEEYDKKAFLYLVLGYTGIFRSHILCFEIVTMASFILFLVCFKKWKEIFLWKQIGLSALSFVLMNPGYLYQTYRYLTCGQFVVNPVSGVPIQEKGLQIAQLFMCFYQAGGSHEFGVNGVTNAVPVGLGFVLLVSALLFLYYVIMYGEKLRSGLKQNGWLSFGFGVGFCILSLLIFPWDRIMRLSDFFSSVISMMQASWHFLTISLSAFSVLGCIVYEMIRSREEIMGKAAGIGLVCLSLFSASYLAANLLFTYDFVRIKLPEEMIYEGLATGQAVVQQANALWYGLEVISFLAILGGIGSLTGVIGKKKGEA